MSDFDQAVRDITEAHSPAIVFGARLADPDEAPYSLREKTNPWHAWSEQATAVLGVAVEIAGSQRFENNSQDELITMLAGLRMGYMKVVSDLADSMDIPEGELHNRVNETLNNAAVDENPDAE